MRQRVRSHRTEDQTRNPIRGAGYPLDPQTREAMEHGFGRDFSAVRVHTDSAAAASADELRARAFTYGEHIVFGAGEYAPQTAHGRYVLAHELAHTVQQKESGARVQRVPLDDDPPAADSSKLSGKTWWNANESKSPLTKSSDIADLEADFQAKVKDFKKALDDAGASISIDTTKRSAERAYVLHYAWQVAKGNVKASEVPAKANVDIVWDHGDETKSKAGASEIVTAASVASKPSLTSNHIAGKAIDWTITWTENLKIKKKDGSETEIKSTPRDGGDPGNTELHSVGKDYGVIKGLNFSPKDPPHWSSDGK